MQEGTATFVCSLCALFGENLPAGHTCAGLRVVIPEFELVPLKDAVDRFLDFRMHLTITLRVRTGISSSDLSFHHQLAHSRVGLGYGYGYGCSYSYSYGYGFGFLHGYD